MEGLTREEQSVVAGSLGPANDRGDDVREREVISRSNSENTIGILVTSPWQGDAVSISAFRHTKSRAFRHANSKMLRKSCRDCGKRLSSVNITVSPRPGSISRMRRWKAGRLAFRGDADGEGDSSLRRRTRWNSHWTSRPDSGKGKHACCLSSSAPPAGCRTKPLARHSFQKCSF